VARPRAVVGALIGLVVAAAGWMLGGVMPVGATGSSAVSAGNWPFTAAGLFAVIAMGAGWQGWPLGAIFGALLFAFFITPYETVALAPYWLFALGGLFVAVTLLLPRGIVGTMRHEAAERRARHQASGTAPAPLPRAAE